MFEDYKFSLLSLRKHFQIHFLFKKIRYILLLTFSVKRSADFSPFAERERRAKERRREKEQATELIPERQFQLAGISWNDCTEIQRLFGLIDEFLCLLAMIVGSYDGFAKGQFKRFEWKRFKLKHFNMGPPLTLWPSSDCTVSNMTRHFVPTNSVQNPHRTMYMMSTTHWVGLKHFCGEYRLARS